MYQSQLAVLNKSIKLFCITTYNFKINFRTQKAREMWYFKRKVDENGTDKTLCLFGKYNLY